MSRCISTFLVMLVTITSLSVTASADEPAAEEREIAEPTAEQLELNEKGVEALVKENPARAVALFTEAFRLGELNILALNLGRAYHALGQCERARETLNSVSELPVISRPSPERINDIAAEYLQEVDEACTEDELAEIDAPELDDQPTAVDHLDGDPRPWGIYTIGAGGLLTITSVGLHLFARSERNRVQQLIDDESSYNGSEVNSAITQREVADTERRANFLDNIALSTAIAGVVVAGIGTYMFLATPDTPDETSSLGISIDSDRVGFHWSTRF